MERNNIICVACPRGCRITVESEGAEIKNIEGYKCEKGKEYAREEFVNPTRILPTTVKVKGGEFPLVPVKTEKPIPKKYLLPAMKEVASTIVEAPVELGEVVIENIMDTGVDIVATRNIKKSEDKRQNLKNPA